MRAKSTLAVIVALLGTVAVMPMAEAAVTERSARNTQKATRAHAATPAAAQSASRTAASAARNAAPQSRTAVTPARTAAVGKGTHGQTRVAAQAPGRNGRQPAAAATSTLHASARAAAPGRSGNLVQVAMPGIVRPAAGAGSGTPIMPVAQAFGLSCVPFARLATGMDISGNGGMWWYNAVGRYARGQQPERGSILAFPGSGAMRSGHVAVVSRVVNARTIEIDHANWGGPGLRRGQVLRGAVVVDVSDRNDWTAVRHQVGFDSTSFGRTYPTQGFIYNRPDNGRTVSAQASGRYDEVAELNSPHAAQHQRLTAQVLGQ
jgi:surface antigen